MLNIYFSTRLMHQIARDLGQRPKQVVLKDPMWDQPDDLIETLALSVAKDIRSLALADRMFAQETALLILHRLLAASVYPVGLRFGTRPRTRPRALFNSRSPGESCSAASRWRLAF